MTATTPTSTKPKRRWLRFSLRTLLVVMLLLGCGLGWVGMQLQQKRRHEAVVKEVKALGGTVDSPVTYLGGDGWLPLESFPAWKEKLFGSYALERSSIDLSHTNATDSTLTRMRGMNCVLLQLGKTNITDDGFESLKRMQNMVWLNLSGTQITDAGLEHLQGLNSLQELYLESTSVTREGVDRLQKAIPGCEIHYLPKETPSESASK